MCSYNTSFSINYLALFISGRKKWILLLQHDYSYFMHTTKSRYNLNCCNCFYQKLMKLVNSLLADDAGKVSEPSEVMLPVLRGTGVDSFFVPSFWQCTQAVRLANCCSIFSIRSLLMKIKQKKALLLFFAIFFVIAQSNNVGYLSQECGKGDCEP